MPYRACPVPRPPAPSRPCRSRCGPGSRGRRASRNPCECRRRPAAVRRPSWPWPAPGARGLPSSSSLFRLKRHVASLAGWSRPDPPTSGIGGSSAQAHRVDCCKRSSLGGIAAAEEVCNLRQLSRELPFLHVTPLPDHRLGKLGSPETEDRARSGRTGRRTGPFWHAGTPGLRPVPLEPVAAEASRQPQGVSTRSRNASTCACASARRPASNCRGEIHDLSL